MQSFRPHGLLFVLAATCIATGCTNNNSTPSAAQNPPAAEQAPPPASIDESSRDTSDVQPCEKITIEDMQPFFNTPITKQVSQVGGCNFETTDGIQGIQIVTSTGVMANLYMDKDKPPTDDGKPGVALTGIGTWAIRESNDIWVYAVKGDMACMIHGDHSGEHAQGSVEEIRGLNIKDSLGGTIPQATAQAIAQNLGTLCNKMWGGGNTKPAFDTLPK